jgi:hypothetical protein
MDRYQVDPAEVDRVVRTMRGQIDEFGALCRQFEQLVPPKHAFGVVGSPAGATAVATHELLQAALQSMHLALRLATENIERSMRNYRSADASGVAGHRDVAASAAAPAALLQRLLSSGLGAGAMHAYLQDHANQVGAGIAEVHVGAGLAEVRLRSGDLVTTPDFTATVGPDGRLYANGQPVVAAAGQEARVYRTMTTPSTR